MKIAYVTTYDASNLRAWSGTGASILQALRASGLTCEPVGGLKPKFVFASKIKKALYASLFSRTYLRDREPRLLKEYATQVENALTHVNPDLVFSPGTLPIAYLRTEKPVVFWTDSTFAGMVNFYPDFSHLCAESLRAGHAAEQAALSHCRLAIYSSEWAANTAVQNYQFDPAKVQVVSFGANLRTERTLPDIQAILQNKSYEVCNLLFVGVDWMRKGGDRAVEIAGRLNRDGVRTELHVVGCRAPTGLPDYVVQHGYISKSTPEGSRELDELFSRAHFFLLPALADCTPVVLAEAASFGLPCLASRVGGIPSVILDGVNGQTFDPQAGAAEYGEYIEGLFSSRKAYEQIALASFGEYAARLNWRVAGKKVVELIREALKSCK